jgi:hypothetical protein
MLVYFAQGKLPWAKLPSEGKADKHKKIMDLKMKLSLEELCYPLPNVSLFISLNLVLSQIS